ncbi:MAG: glycosyltransferase family 2 protein [Bacteroidetes bacterium]|nr:glycosyltransferase family 2 protein [Bacteroidota bacterium]
MLFQFIRYTQPGWQFNLRPVTNHSFASCYVMEKDIEISFLDKRYQTKSAQLADAGYRLWNSGVLLKSTQSEINRLHDLPQPTLHDEYLFVHKYWGKPWALFALFLRLLTFRNIFKECKAYHATRKTERMNPHANPIRQDLYEPFRSALIESNPLVAVIIPTLNRYEYLKNVLHGLENQSYKNFEVIVIDQSDSFQETFYDSYDLKIKLIRQEEKKLWTARNNALKSTTAKWLLFFDDDSIIEPEWIEQHLKCIDFFDAQISAGVSIATSGGKVQESYQYFRWADQFDSGNALVCRTVFQQIGLFDERFNGLRMGDAEFGFRAYISGIKSISNPYAGRIHLKASRGGLRDMGSWDGFRPKNWFAPKPVPSVVYLFKKYFPSSLYRNSILIGIMLSNIPYRFKKNSRMLLLSIFLTIIQSPILFIRYLRAKKIAKRIFSEAGNEKPKIVAPC